MGGQEEKGRESCAGWSRRHPGENGSLGALIWVRTRLRNGDHGGGWSKEDCLGGEPTWAVGTFSARLQGKGWSKSIHWDEREQSVKGKGTAQATKGPKTKGNLNLKANK